MDHTIDCRGEKHLCACIHQYTSVLAYDDEPSDPFLLSLTQSGGCEVDEESSEHGDEVDRMHV